MPQTLSRAELSALVTLQDTAETVMSGDLAVLATPRLAAWMEHVSVLACHDLLTPGQTTVGSELCVKHIAPSVIGTHIHLQATVTSQNGRKLTIEIAVEDSAGSVATAKHTRYIVDKKRFMQRALSR